MIGICWRWRAITRDVEHVAQPQHQSLLQLRQQANLRRVIGSVDMECGSSGNVGRLVGSCDGSARIETGHCELALRAPGVVQSEDVADVPPTQPTAPAAVA